MQGRGWGFSVQLDESRVAFLSVFSLTTFPPPSIFRRLLLPSPTSMPLSSVRNTIFSASEAPGVFENPGKGWGAEVLPPCVPAVADRSPPPMSAGRNVVKWFLVAEVLRGKSNMYTSRERGKRPTHRLHFPFVPPILTPLSLLDQTSGSHLPTVETGRTSGRTRQSLFGLLRSSLSSFSSSFGEEFWPCSQVSFSHTF